MNQNKDQLEMTAGPDWNAALIKAIQAARAGKDILLQYLGRLEHVEEKFQQGLVSEADRESEKVIFQVLRQHFPNDEFLGEESAYQQALPKTPLKEKGRGRWIVDPLDGTTNYVHRFPVFCVSIGYEYEGELQLAVIDVPMMGEVYTAIRGQGAFMNGQKIQASQTSEIKNALLATGFFGESEEQLQEQLKVFGPLVRKARAIRRPGAAAYDLALVARGVFDGFWEKNLKPWDSAAGALLVREAGGQVTTYRGTKYHPYHNSILASGPKLWKSLCEEISPLANKDTD